MGTKNSKWKGTKGDWTWYAQPVDGIDNAFTGRLICEEKGRVIGRINEVHIQESKENANLIADAGTTINKCDLFPSELLEQRDELLEALKELHCLLEDNQGDATWYLHKHHNKAKKAIEKATNNQ